MFQVFSNTLEVPFINSSQERLQVKTQKEHKRGRRSCQHHISAQQPTDQQSVVFLWLSYMVDLLDAFSVEEGKKISFTYKYFILFVMFWMAQKCFFSFSFSFILLMRRIFALRISTQLQSSAGLNFSPHDVPYRH